MSCYSGMSQHTLSLEMSDPHTQLGSKPLNGFSLQPTQDRLGKRQFSHPFRLGRPKRPRRVQDGGAGELELAVVICRRRPGHAVSAAIPARCPLGHDALEPDLRRGLKEPGAVDLDVIAELDRGAGILLDQLPEERPPFHEKLPPRIVAIEVHEIEGKEHEPMSGLVNGRAQGIEVGRCRSRPGR